MTDKFPKWKAETTVVKGSELEDSFPRKEWEHLVELHLGPLVDRRPWYKRLWWRIRHWWRALWKV